APDPEDETVRVLASVKCNLAAPPPSLRYTLIPAGETVRVKWLGESTHTANGLLRAAADEEGDRGARGDAMAFLRTVLANGPFPTKEVQREARKAGHSERTLDRAKAALRVKSKPSGGKWMWSLPDDDQGCHGVDTDILGTLGT